MERPSSGLRRGKWTQEEEAYVERVIRDFNGGLLDAAPGTTLRSYLSDKLNCDPMRITKKFTGDASIGKRVFHPRENASPAAVERSRREIAELEATWRRKLEQQRREAEAADRKRRAADEPLTVSTGSTRRIRAWLARAKVALEAATTPAAIDAVLADGDRLRADLGLAVAGHFAFVEGWQTEVVADRRASQHQPCQSGERPDGPVVDAVRLGQPHPEAAQRRRQGGGRHIEFGPHQDRRATGDHIADRAAHNAGDDPHDRCRYGRQAVAHGFRRAEHRVGRQPDAVGR